MGAVNDPSELLQIIEAGIAAVRPAVLFPKIFANPGAELTRWKDAPSRFLLTIGKAAMDSTAAVLAQCTVTDYFILSSSASTLLEPIDPAKVHPGSHPVPDARSLSAAEDLLSWLASLPDGAALLVVLSGGASALMVLPLDGISLEDKMKVNELLLKSGASIQEMNVVRKHLSAVKGGRLAAITSRLRTSVLVISDVIGDDLATIGSGPFFPDPSTYAQARAILEQYEIWNRIPDGARTIVQKGVAGTIPETPKEFEHPVPHQIIASNRMAREAAGEKARQLGYQVTIAEEETHGFVEEVASSYVTTLTQMRPQTAFIAGGEITVRVKGNGVGGRNQHLALLLTEQLARTPICFAAAGTDGIDGNSPAAGAWTNGETAQRARDLGIDFQNAIVNFDSYPFFQRLQQSIQTGATGTNVMDLYIGLS